VTTGEVRWQAPLAGQPFDAVLRPELGEGGLVVVDVLGATYGLSLADGGEAWRNVPLNYGGMADVGPSVLLNPARYGDPHLLLDPATGAEVGTVRPAGWYGLDVSLYPRLGDEVIMPRPGKLVRRDIGTVPLTESDPDPTWAVELLAQAGPPALVDEHTVVVPTPLGARAHDAATGELLWAYADLP
jgi:outer membrane protein assembly factor BamB